MTFMKERKAISPVIATVILVAVAITVAVGVSYWMSGISSQYTSFEKIEIQSGYSAIKPAAPNLGIWIIKLELKNSGSATANLIRVFVNDAPIDPASYGFDVGTDVLAAGVIATDMPPDDPTTPTGGKMPIDSGKMGNVEIYVASDLFSSGTTINVKLHSAGGMDYIKLIKLV